MTDKHQTIGTAPFQIEYSIRVLVDRRGALGDVIMITPVLRELRRRYGAQAFIQVITNEVAALANNPHINKVVRPQEINQADQWDLYVNLNDAYELNITSHYIESYLYRAFGLDIDGIDKSLVLESSIDEQNKVDLIKQTINSQYIVVHMRRWYWENRNISTDTWIQLMSWVESNYPGLKIVSVGAQHDLRVPTDQPDRYVNLNDQLSLGELRHLVASASAYIGADSAPFHVASTTNTPIIALLSQVYPEQFLPWRNGTFGKDVFVVQSQVPCVGCYARQAVPVRTIVCENTDQWACARKFDCNQIIAALDNILSNNRTA